jgi:hypothetical protein
MRHLILAAIIAAVSSIASAEEAHAAGFANNAGGMTIITDRTHYCGSKGMYDGYAFGSEKGQFTRFCWVAKNDAILAVYESGDLRTYHIKSFELIDVEPEVNNNQP